MGNYEEEEWEEIRATSNSSISSAAPDEEFEIQRIRDIDGTSTSLSISEGRGVASVFYGKNRIQIFDLEDDEYAEEEEEEEGEEE